MARGVDAGPRRGEIWHYGFKRPDKRRPVVVLTRQEVLPMLHTAMVAPITSTIRGLPSEVAVGADEGLRHDSAINLDHVQTVEQRLLHRYVGSLSPTKMRQVPRPRRRYRPSMRQVCRLALAVATGCA